MSCEEALAHPWMAAFDSGDHVTTKSLSKEKMKRFLARQKWKVAHFNIAIIFFYLEFEKLFFFSDVLKIFTL